MGVFASYDGNIEIPAPLRTEFNQRMLKLLNLGGMMQIEKVSMFGKEILLLKPLSLSEKNEVSFYFNYFEDDSWETACFYADDSSLWSGKIGNLEFNNVMSAAYMLYELYTKDIGFARVDGALIDEPDFIIGWFNQIFGTKYSLEKRFRLWDSLEFLALDGKEGELDGDDLVMEFEHLLPNHALIFTGGTELADILCILHGTDIFLKVDELIPDTYPAEIMACREKIKAYFQERGKKALNNLWVLLKKDRNQRKQEKGDLAPIATATLSLPARMIAYLATEILDMDFWSEWKKLRKHVYHDEDQKVYVSPEILSRREEGRHEPVPKVSTCEFLYQVLPDYFHRAPEELKDKPKYKVSDLDRLFWWDGTEEVNIDDKAEEWVMTIAKRHTELLAETDKAAAMFSDGKFLPYFIKLLKDIDDYYKRIMPFQCMFYDFIEHSQQREYQAAVLLLQELYEDNKPEGKAIEHLSGAWDLCNRKVTFNGGRLNMKRYLSLLANKKLRQRYLGF